MIQGPFDRTVRLQVKITEGQLRLADGSVMPELAKDADAELILSAASIADPQVLSRLTGEQRTRFLNKGETLYARLQRDAIPDELQKQAQSFRTGPGSRALFVPFVLEDVLWLTLRTGKKGQLQDCSVRIPALDANADSINEAYTKISVAFEPRRRSHTGNVFKCVYVEGANGVLEPLEVVRAEIKAEPRHE